jgi:uncharacterized HAD superfamily protein
LENEDENMNIGIDIDDTITNSSNIFIKYAKKFNKIYNINYNIDEAELNQKKAFGWSRKNQNVFAKRYLKRILQEAEPNAGVIEGLQYLKKMGYRLVFITARNDAEVSGIYELTKQWLINNNIKFDKLIVNCNNKLQTCLDNNIRLFIDDNYNVCKDIWNSKKIEVFLYETNYNKKYDNLNFVKVKNWNEIINLIKVKYEK